MRRVLMPIVLLAVALGALFGSSYASDQLHDGLGEIADDDTVRSRVGTPLVSTRRLTEILAPSLTEPDFFTNLDNMMATAPVGACLNVSLDKREFYASGDTIQVMPSDALMLLTAASAYEVLGPDYRLTTSVQSIVPMEDGVVNGDIYLVGGGDPLLKTNPYLALPPGDPNPLHTRIDDMAQQLVDQGLILVTGAVVGDASRYDNLPYVPSWPENNVTSGSIGTLLALQFDDGWLQPPSPEEAAEAGDQAVTIQRAEDPPFYAAALFDDMLEARDVVIRRSPRTEEVPTEEGEVYLLGFIESAPVSELVAQMLDNRDVETAELLLKEIGLARSGVGSTSDGVQAVEAILANAGISSNQFRLFQYDGSGFDPANVATCPMFTSLLDSEEFSPLFHELLPTAAQSNALQPRFASVDDPSRIRAHTGQKAGATVMTGYIDIGLGQELTFTFMANEPGATDNHSLRELEQQITSHLASLSAKPSLDDLGVEPIHHG